MNRNLFFYGLIVVVAVAVAGLLGQWLGADLKFALPEGQTVAGAFWERFQVLFLMAVLIERSVQVYLKASDQDGIEIYQASTNTVIKVRDASKPSMIAGLFVSILVAICGVRIINTFAGLPPDVSLLRSMAWNGVDVVVSAGLMAGGSDLFHKLTDIIESVLDSANRRAKGQTSDGVAAQTVTVASAAQMNVSLAAARSYTIHINRPIGKDVDQGTLTFRDGGVSITSACWWDPGNRIKADTYRNCSKTVMATRPIDAIYLPDAVSKDSGDNQIFIHRGSSSANSLGCIAVDTANFEALYKHIQPMNGRNITVVVKDV
jgi:hypothetical protein